MFDELNLEIDISENDTELEKLSVLTGQNTVLSQKGSDIASLHSSRNLLPSCGHSRLVSLEAWLTIGHCIYLCCNLCGCTYVRLVKAGACQASEGAAFFWMFANAHCG